MARRSKQSATQSSSTLPTTPLTDNAAAARFLEKHRAKPARSRKVQPSTFVDSQSRAVDGAQPAAEGRKAGTRRAQGAGMHKAKRSTRIPQVGTTWKLTGGNLRVRLTGRERVGRRWVLAYEVLEGSDDRATPGEWLQAGFLRLFTQEQPVPSGEPAQVPEEAEQSGDVSPVGITSAVDSASYVKRAMEEATTIALGLTVTATACGGSGSPAPMAIAEPLGECIHGASKADCPTERAADEQEAAMPIHAFSTVSAGKVLAGLTGRVHSLWCDGCRQSPTMSVDQAEREQNKAHKWCPAGNGTWRLLVEVAPQGGGVDWQAVLAARAVCERVFYWLAMGDEGPESTLPDAWKGETTGELKELEGLSDEARVAARLLGGLREEEEQPEHSAPLCNPPACTLPLHHEGMCPEPAADVCAVLNPNGSGFWCELPPNHPEDDHAAQVEPLTRLYWPRMKGTPTPGEWEVDANARGVSIRSPGRLFSLVAREVADTNPERPEVEANFRLMAAAPRLVATLERELEYLRGLANVGTMDAGEVRRRIFDVSFALMQAGKEVRHVG